MDALILAAGYGTRLYPLTKNFPKPLLEIEKGKPVINYILEKLQELNIDKIYVITNNRYYSNFIEWKNKSKYNIEIINDGTLNEEDKLGAVGDINFTIDNKKIKNPLLIIAGDNLFDFSLIDMYNYFIKTNKDVISLCESHNIEDIKRGSCVLIDNKNKVLDFEEKPQNPKSNLHGNCLYIYTPETLKLFKQYIKESPNKDQPGRFVQWLHKKKDILGYVNKGKFIDIGTHESLERARKEFN